MLETGKHAITSSCWTSCGKTLHKGTTLWATIPTNGSAQISGSTFAHKLSKSLSKTNMRYHEISKDTADIYILYNYIYTVTNSLSHRKVPRAEDTKVPRALEDLTVSHPEKPAASKKVLKIGREKPRTFTVVVVNGRHISDLQDFKISQSPAACERPGKTQTSNDIK